MTFQEGDRVVFQCPTWDGPDAMEGMVATIVIADPVIRSYLVEFDSFLECLHTANGRIPSGLGWWVEERESERCMSLVPQSPQDVQSKVLRKCKTLWNKSKWVQRNKTLAY